MGGSGAWITKLGSESLLSHKEKEKGLVLSPV
jgi:hypothetical protein